MLATVTIARQQQSFFGVWLGSTLGKVVADGIAIVVGKCLGSYCLRNQLNTALRLSS